LTSHSQLTESTATLSLLESAVTQFRSLTPLEYAVTQKGEGVVAAGGRTFRSDACRGPLSGFSRGGIGFADRITSHVHSSHCTGQNAVPQLPSTLSAYAPSLFLGPSP